MDVDGAALAATLATTALVVASLMALTFAVALRVGRHSVIDVTWGLGFAAVAVTAYLLHTGDDLRAVVVLVAVVAWGLRLAAHIAWRSRGHGEDPRYQAILSRAPGNPHRYVALRVYLPQAVILWFVSLPVQVAMAERDGTSWVLAMGIAVWALGLAVETVADLQLLRFRADPPSRGRVLDSGLWRYSRHPNYFGDALAWWGIFLLAADGGWAGAATVLSPLLMTWLLAAGTGKPLLERDIAERRPDYARYLQTTSGFVPWFPRSPRRAVEPTTTRSTP